MKFDITYRKIKNKDFLVIKPLDRLSDSEYNKLKPNMESMGGHWSERENGFLFLKEYLDRDKQSQEKENMQFFPTPKSVAKRVVELSGLNKTSLVGDRPFVLEPSAGTGSLLEALPYHIKHFISCYVVEPNGDNAEILRSKGYLAEEMTFEEFYKLHRKDKKHITHVIMNPPFSELRDINHVKMAYELMVDGGVLVAIIPENRLYYTDKESIGFKEWLKDTKAIIEEVEYGAFKESGTTVDTVIIKIVKE